VKKLFTIAAVAGCVLFLVKRSKNAKAEADLWREATAPTTQPLGSASTNGSAPAHSGASDSRNN